ncbi:nephrin-like isoform X3 [Glandiceps talaboti]
MDILKTWFGTLICCVIFSFIDPKVTSVCKVTVTSPNGQTVYASENEHITAQCVYSTEGCSDLYYLEWCFGTDCSESIVHIGSTTIWQNGYDSEFSLTDSTSLVIPVTSSRNNQVYTCSVNYDFGNGLGRGSLNVAIIVPPSITHHPPSMSPNEGTSSVTLSCQADGDPTPTFTWTKDGSDLQINTKYTVTGGSLVIHNIVKSDDGEYICVADNGYGTAATSNPATLTVNYPPGEPICTRSPSPHSGTPSYYLLNTGVTLTCEVTDGRPTATVQWYKNEESSPLSPTQSVNGNTIERTYDFSIGKSDNTATYTCKVTNTVLSNPLECELTFTVYFPPTSVTISGYSSPRKEAETLTLTCTTASSNPAAEISWYKNDGSWSSGNGESTNTVQDSNGEHNGQERKQELEITLKPSHNGARYQCKAKNSHYSPYEVQSANKEITVYFKPSSVTLTGYSNPVKSGDVLILVCETESSNPHADISWFKNDTSLTSSTTETIKTSTTSGSDNGGEKTRQELHITLSQSHNGVQFQCHARNSQFAMNTKVESTNQGINVYFPPLQVSLLADKSNPVQEDMTLTLTCTTESSNPVATISWYKNGVLWSESEGETMGSAEQSNGDDNGKVTTQQLTITLTPYHNKDIYTCKGRNDQFSGNVVESDPIQLNVHYTPFVLNETENSKSAADEGEPATLICEIDSNPDATITWYKDGNEVDINDKFSIKESNIGTQFKSTLLLNRTERIDHGNYICKADNNIGSVNFTVTLLGKSDPDAPTNIEITSRSYTSLTIEIIPGFDGGEPESIMYYVEYHNSTHEDWQPWPSNGQGTRNTQMTITDLIENTTYVIKARAENSLGLGPYSNEYASKTYGKPLVTVDDGKLTWTLHEDPDLVCVKVEALAGADDWIVENECVDVTITEYTVNDKSVTYRITYCTIGGECEESVFKAVKVAPDDKENDTLPGIIGISIAIAICLAAVIVLSVLIYRNAQHKKKGLGAAPRNATSNVYSGVENPVMDHSHSDERYTQPEMASAPSSRNGGDVSGINTAGIPPYGKVDKAKKKKNPAKSQDIVVDPSEIKLYANVDTKKDTNKQQLKDAEYQDTAIDMPMSGTHEEPPFFSNGAGAYANLPSTRPKGDGADADPAPVPAPKSAKKKGKKDRPKKTTDAKKQAGKEERSYDNVPVDETNNKNDMAENPYEMPVESVKKEARPEPQEGNVEGLTYADLSFQGPSGGTGDKPKPKLKPKPKPQPEEATAYSAVDFSKTAPKK